VNVFWILAALLTTVATAFVVVPLLRRPRPPRADAHEQLNLALFERQRAELDADLAAGKLDAGQHEAAGRDLERALLHDLEPNAAAPSVATDVRRSPVVALVAMLALPAVAAGLYLVLGSPGSIARLDTLPATDAAGHAGLPSLEALAARLAERLRQTPDDAAGWAMLGRTYLALERFQPATDAFAQAYRLAPRDPDLLVGYADALASANRGELEGRPAELIEEALRLDPEHVVARWLSGLLAAHRGQYQAAIVAWNRALAQLEPNGPDAAQLRALIAAAQAQVGPPAPGATAPAPPAPAASATAVRVQVALDAGLAVGLAPDTTVFVYAKAAEGPPMPLAVQRLTVAALPAELTLDDGMALDPALKISRFSRLIVGARVSPSGQALPQPGDLEGESDPVAPGATVTVRIARVRP